MKTPFTYNFAGSEENHRVDSRDWRASVSSLPPIKVREPAFTYNVPLTMSKRLALLEQQQRRWSIILAAVVILGSVGVIWLFWRWL